MSIIRVVKKDELASLIDELGALEAELGPLRAKIARLAIVRAAVREAFAGRPPAEAVQSSGREFTVHLGPAGNESTADLPRLASLIGTKRLLDIVSVSLRTLEAQCGPAVYAAVVTTTPTGTRPLTSFRREATPVTLPEQEEQKEKPAESRKRARGRPKKTKAA